LALTIFDETVQSARIGCKNFRDSPPVRLGNPDNNNGLRPSENQVWRFELDLAGHIVTKAGEPVNLTSAEFDLLHMFFESPGQVLTRDKLVERVLGRKFSPFDRSIDFHITNLRRKLGTQPNGTERIRQRSRHWVSLACRRITTPPAVPGN